MTSPSHPAAMLRNIGIVAHINAGKTTLTERVLYDSGRQPFMGDVDSGTAAMDWTTEEQERGISIHAGVTSVPWRGHRIFLVDTPGHVDFAAEVERCLRVLDGAIVVLDGVRGVESQTEAIWKYLDDLRIPRLVFVNKLDRPSASFASSLSSLERRFGCRSLAAVLPILDQGRLVGLMDVVGGMETSFVEAAAASGMRVEEARQAIVEACAELDAGILEDWVEGRDIDGDRLWARLRELTIRRAIVPAFCGSALLNRGVDLLLDGVCRLLPSPEDRLRMDRLVRPADGSRTNEFVGLVFKVQDEDEERLACLRVYEGSVAPGDPLETADGGLVEIESLWELNGMLREPILSAGAGYLVGAVTNPPLRTGQTLRTPGSEVVLEPVKFSTPVLTMKLEPQTSEDFGELERRARAMALEDPTLIVRTDPDTGTLQVSGMGELHLEVFGSRLNRGMARPARLGPPAVARFESVERAAEAFAECSRSVGDQQIEAWAKVSVAPQPGATSVRWEVAPGGRFSHLEADVVGELKSLAANGVLAGHPIRNLCIDVLDVGCRASGAGGDTLVLDAVALACRRALEAAHPMVLEPVMRFRLECPNDTLGAVLADLQGRGVDLDSTVPGATTAEVSGRVRLHRVLDYATRLRSITRGRGSVALALEGFEPVSGGQ